jgi:hypothetical protein
MHITYTEILHFKLSTTLTEWLVQSRYTFRTLVWNFCETAIRETEKEMDEYN